MLLHQCHHGCVTPDIATEACGSMPNLPSHLDAPRGAAILITDQLGSPAEFLLCHTIVSSLNEGVACILVSTSNDLHHWSAITSRSLKNIQTYIDSKKFTFIDGASIVATEFNIDGASGNGSSRSSGPLKQIYSRITESINDLVTLGVAGGRPPILLLDDMSTLEWIGINQVDILRLYRAVIALCRKHDVSVIVLHHTISPDSPSPILIYLLKISHSIMDVVPFASGRSGAVSGEVRLGQIPSSGRFECGSKQR
ncbi:uncharacterized protein EI90DRAFT_2657739 [Cantharellus anzutake]|uniref:uncharacterized protein n=1 Tax=Cantharellus anzutake TaxID=1750568 RepID=UPI00190436C5|nr:uncharacterized protein EI90DRAFT_2657739 [Cantharellus anzutake]KAF8337489.1 hypothetical protein EI90DRAFT_2657739 [Cantharellus anzutake]